MTAFTAKLAVPLLLLGCLTPHRLNAGDLPLLWQTSVGLTVDSCAAIDSNGVVYVTSSGSPRFSDMSGGKLIAFDTNGAQKWAFPTSVEIHSSPAVGADGTIYFGCRDRRFYAISPTGEKRWSFLTGAWVDSSPAIATNGDVYFGSWDGNFYALNPGGRKLWEFGTGEPIDSSPAIALDGTIYFGSHNKKFYALNPNGSKKWEFATEGAIISSPAIDSDGTIYFTSVDGRLYALHPDGTRKWQIWTGGTRSASPVIGPEGDLYIGANKMFYALKSDGSKRWDFGFPIIDGAAVVLDDAKVYFSCYGEDGELLLGWSGDGRQRLATVVLGVSTASSPAIGRDGTIYVGAGSAPFRAFKGTNGLAKSPWPKFRADAAQTGRVQN